MHRFEEHETELVCNKCGRKIAMRGDIPLEDVFYAQKVWGYFSERDGVRHSWSLCEKCYEELIQTFKVPPCENEETELL